ncbi:MAG: HD domain-containing protein [Lachnospiraceae bacterium]|nr:HD domain-containing protein [Lachnospiraceae bacterium]
MGIIVNYNLTKELEHGVYVSCLVRDLSIELGLSDAVTYQFQLAGLMHDIGKLKLANYLYGNEEIVSPLLIEEMKYVRMHPMLTYSLLKERGFSDLVLDAVRYHHEDYDGTGYPSNLVGDEIPLGARVIRVCDVFAALTTDRPYRKRFEVDEAMSLMIDEIKHFDMKIFLAFQRVVHRNASKYHVHFPDSDYELVREYLTELAAAEAAEVTAVSAE